MTGFFGPQFGPKPEHWEQAFREILDETTLPAHLKSKEVWLPVMQEGDMRSASKFLMEALGDTRWDWPWFNNWRDKFADANQWPYMWSKYAKAWNGLMSPQFESYVKYYQDILVRERIVILVHSLMIRANTLRTLKDILASNVKYGLKIGIRLLTGDDGPLVQILEDQLAERLEEEEYFLLPPLFPGHRGCLSPVVPDR